MCTSMYIATVIVLLPIYEHVSRCVWLTWRRRGLVTLGLVCLLHLETAVAESGERERERLLSVSKKRYLSG